VNQGVAKRFRGESTHKVDSKGRVSIPADFRSVLREGDPDAVADTQPQLVLIYGLTGKKCLEGYTIDGVDALDDEVEQHPRGSTQRAALERALNTQSTYLQLDPNGRIVLSQKLKDRIGVTGEAFFAGMGRRFQIWEPSEYDADQAKLENWVAENTDHADPLSLLGG